MTQTDEEIKASTSMAQQVMDLKQEVKDLKIQLRARESRLMATMNVINGVLELAEKEVNKTHKHLQKNISNLTNWVGEDLSTMIQMQINKNLNLPIGDQIKLSEQFRNEEGIQPLLIEEEGIVHTAPRPKDLKKNG